MDGTVTDESHGTFHMTNECRQNPFDKIAGQTVIKDENEPAITFRQTDISAGDYLMFSFSKKRTKQFNG